MILVFNYKEGEEDLILQTSFHKHVQLCAWWVDWRQPSCYKQGSSTVFYSSLLLHTNCHQHKTPSQEVGNWTLACPTWLVYESWTLVPHWSPFPPLFTPLSWTLVLSLQDVCKTLWCYTGGRKCETKHLPAAEGTTCGIKKVTHYRYCAVNLSWLITLHCH